MENINSFAMAKKDLYLDKEERFGFLLSRMYALGTWIKPMRDIYRFVIGDVAEASPRSVLDVGTGPGVIPIELSKRIKAASYGVDPSKHMIAIAKGRARSAGAVSFALGSSRYVPFNRKFDMIISVLSFHHWQKKEESLRYLSGLLNTNGQIRVYEVEKSRSVKLAGVRSHLLDASEAVRVARAAGLKVDGIRRRNGFICLSIRK